MQVSESLQWILGVTIVVYCVVMYLIGYFAQGKINDHEDFIVAGRRLPLSLAWMTLLATWFGAGTMLASADEVRSEGLQAMAMDPLGAGVCLLLAGLLVAGPLWRMKLLTVPDFFRRKYGPRTEIVSALIMVPSYFGWIAAQFVALAGMLELFFGMDPRVGLVIVAVIGTGYTLMGGMWSVTLTDAVQIVLVLLGLIVLGGVVLMHLGDGHMPTGLATLWNSTPPEKRVIIPHHDAVLFWQWTALFAAGALGNLPGQDLLQRVFASKSEQVARRSCYVAGVVYLAFGAIPVGMGLAASLLTPTAERAILPALASQFLTPFLAVVFVVTLMSAVLSTIDSAIIAPASVVSQNLVPKACTISPLALNRWAVLGIALCSLGMAYLGESAYSLLEGAYEMTLVGLFVPLMFGIYTEPRSGAPALACMLVGTGLWLWHYVAGWGHFFEPLPTVGAWGVSLPLAATACGLIAYLIFEPPWRLRRRRVESV